MKNTTEKKVHKLLDRPILSSILLLGFVLVISSLLQVPKYLIWGTDINGTAQYIYDIIESFLLLLVTELIYTNVWFKGEFEGTLKGDPGYGFRLLIPAAIVDVIIFIYERIMGMGNLNSILFVISASVVAGIIEEVTFRSLILSNLMRITKTYKGMLAAAVSTSLLFGTAHLGNLLNGANFSSTISQFFSATCIGLFFAAVYLICGSIVPLMVFHFGHDILALLFLGVNELGATTEAATMTSTIENVIMNIVLAAMTVYILRPANYEKIRRTWDTKWQLQYN